MQINNKFLSQMAQPDLNQALSSATNNLALNFNCVRIGIVEEFYPENLTVQVKIASKRVLAYNSDGTQKVRDYAPIYAKVCYCSPFETFPLKQGDEVVLLFNDRELETWFINGQANLQNHDRMHDLTDAIAIAGIRSLPKMIQILTDALHLFYGDSDIQLKNETIVHNSTTHVFNGDVVINGNLQVSGTITATGEITSGAIMLTKHVHGETPAPTGNIP